MSCKQTLKACTILVQKPTIERIEDAVDSINYFRGFKGQVTVQDAEKLIEILWPKQVNHVVYTYDTDQ